MKRLPILLIIVITIFGCKPQNNDVINKLHPENGYGVFMPGKRIIFPNNDSIEYKGIPKGLNEFVVRSMPLQSAQYFWDNYKKGLIDKSSFLEIVSHFQIDTTKLADISYDYQVAILIGTNMKGKRVIIIDANNDEDFSGEKMLEYEFPLSIEEQKKVVDNLPIVLTNYEFYLGGNVLNKSIDLKPNPYKGSLGVGYNTNDEIEKKYDLFISVPKYRKGVIIINETKYDVFISNGFTSPSYGKRNASVFFSKINDTKPSELDGDIPYQIGDVFNANGLDYLIDSISIWGNELFLKYIGKNNKPVGITEGYYMPKFEAKHLDNSIFELKQYQDKYILLDFWGTWCSPCIKMIPELKKIDSAFSDDKFVLVSVAYDSDPKEVGDFIAEENMNWEHLFISQDQEYKNSLIEKLKISSFPSTILISPKGKILARNKTMEEIKEILKTPCNKKHSAFGN